MIFVIQGETPAKKNSRITSRRTGRSFPSKRFSAWHKDSMQQLFEQLPKPLETIHTPCRVSITFVHGDLRRRDSDNGVSSILDLLVDSHILEDDKWEIVQEICTRNLYEKNKARAEIVIEFIENRDKEMMCESVNT